MEHLTRVFKALLKSVDCLSVPQRRLDLLT